MTFLQNTQAELEEAREGLREMQSSGFSLYQKFLKLEGRHRTLKLVLIYVAFFIVVFVAVYAFEVDASLTLAGADQTQTIPIVGLPEKYGIEDIKWGSFTHYDIICDASDRLTLAGSEERPEPVLGLESHALPHEVGVFLFESAASGFDQIDAQIPCTVAENQLSSIYFRILRPDGTYYTLAQVPMVALEDVKIMNAKCEWADYVGKKEINSYLANYDLITNNRPSISYGIDRMTHYKLTFTVDHADQDLTIHHNRSLWYSLTLALAVAVALTILVATFLQSHHAFRSAEEIMMLQQDYACFVSLGPDDEESDEHDRIDESD